MTAPCRRCGTPLSTAEGTCQHCGLSPMATTAASPSPSNATRGGLGGTPRRRLIVVSGAALVLLLIGVIAAAVTRTMSGQLDGSLVSVLSDSGASGSGFFIAHRGRILIVTARHVVQFAGAISVRRRLAGEDGGVLVVYPRVHVVAADFEADLALLEIENLTSGVTPLVLAASTPAPGTLLQVWGTPDTPTLSGQPLEFSQVPANLQQQLAEPPIDLWTGKTRADLQSVARLYLVGDVRPGHSGGPVIDPTSGKVVGVTTMRLKENQGIAVTSVRRSLLPPSRLWLAKTNRRPSAWPQGVSACCASPQAPGPRTPRSQPCWRSRA